MWDLQIRAYLLGKLPPSKKKELERMLRDEPEFVTRMALLRAEMASAELLIAADTRQLLQQWRTEKPPETLGINRPSWMLLLATALFVVLLILLFRHQSPSSPNATPSPLPSPAAGQPVPDTLPTLQLPRATAPAKKPPENYWAMARQQIQNPLSANLRQPAKDSTLSIFQQAQRAYAAGNYQQTLDLLAKTDSTRQQSATYLSAHALFQLRRFDLATAQFEQLIARNSRQFRFPSEWGLLMCRLADRPRREKEFRQQLNDLLAQPQHPYFEQAKALRQTLKE